MKVGDRLGPFEVLGVIGAGAMGEVYRARDTNLQRDVAIKVLPAIVADNPRRLLRFEREARALAALNHPNIATVHAIHDGAIVMEFVEGEDLSWRLRRGALPLAEALSIARQVAEALASAHDAGIVHRDLKPANIKVRVDGTVKVLDFGLAKSEPEVTESRPESGSGSGSGSGSDEGNPTLSIAADITVDGAVIGTAAYMSPEQAKGQVVDKRADVWSFGVVLFEMLAGRRPFVAAAGSNADVADTIAQVLASDPAWNLLPADTPPAIRRLLARCLTKHRKQRLHDMSDARLEIDEATSPDKADEPTAGPRGSQWLTALALTAVSLAAGTAIGVIIWKTPVTTLPVAHTRIGVEPAEELHAGGIHPFVVLPVGGARTALEWSPDGQTLAFIGVRNGVRQVYLRDLASDAARPLAGTEGAYCLTFSPDGQQLAFCVAGAVRKIGIANGLITTIWNTDRFDGISWGPSFIVAAGGAGLRRLDASSREGAHHVLTEPRDLVRHSSPFLLPGDRAMLFTEHEKQWTSGDERVMVMSLAPGATAKVLLSDAADARYLPTGHIAFLRQGMLFVVPFDAQALELRGEPAAVISDVAQATLAWDSHDLTLAGQFDISSNGSLAYVSGPASSFPGRNLVSVDRSGRITPLAAPAKGYRNHIELSPDGRRIAVSIQTTTDVHLYSYDLVTGALSRMADSLEGEVTFGSWTRDLLAVGVINGGRIASALLEQDVVQPPVKLEDSTAFWPSSLSRDGLLVGMRYGDLWLYSKKTPPRAIAATKGVELQPMWSPDGRWLVYTSDTTGRPEVYVQPFPGPGEAIMVSNEGGSSPAWNPNGRELFYIEPGVRSRMMAVSVSAVGLPGRPRPLFGFADNGLFLGTSILTPYTVALDGQSFYAVREQTAKPAPVTQVHVIFNWFEELKAKARVPR